MSRHAPRFQLAGNCGSCKWWTRFSDDRHGACARIAPASSFDASVLPADARAYVTADLDQPTLRTTEMFGCVEWTEGGRNAG